MLARDATAADLAKVAGMKPKRASPALAELTRRGILERLALSRGRVLHAMHDRYADAVLAAMPERRIRAARRRAGNLLARQSANDFRGLSRAAFELAAAGDTERAILALERALELDPARKSTHLNLGIAAILSFYAPMFSWIGVLPAALLHWGALRNGYGGWATALVIGLLLGLILSSYLGPLAAIFAPPIAIFYWWVLKLFDPQALRPPPAA